MYRSILIALKPGISNEAGCREAFDLARRARLRVTGMAVIDTSSLTSAEDVPTLLHEARQAANATVRAFLQQGRAAGVECEAHAPEAELRVAIVTAAQRADLLIVGHRAGKDLLPSPGSLQHILQHCPRPALVVPAAAPRTNRALIAYDGSLQAARAVQAFASSGLYQDHRVHVLSIQEDPAVAKDVASLSADYLRSYGMEVERHCETPHDPLGEQILAAVERVHPDLLVMGAYGEAALHEFFFGSATRAVLSAITIPVLLAH